MRFYLKGTSSVFSPTSQPVIADGNTICWETVLNFLAFFAPQAQPALRRKAAKQVRADQSATTQASRQSWLEPACRRAFIQLPAFSKRTKKSKSARPTKYKHMQTFTSSFLSWCVMLPLVNCSFSPSFLFRPCMLRRAQGCFRGPWSSWHLQGASSVFAPKTMDTRFIHSHFVHFLGSGLGLGLGSIIPCERA